MKLRLLFIMAAVLSVTAVMAQTPIQRKASGSQKILFVRDNTGESNSNTSNFVSLFGNDNQIIVINTVEGGAVPGDISDYDQVWDIRYNIVMTEDEQNAYAAFLQSGKRLFLMGEHLSFMDRNNSISSFVERMGGGSDVEVYSEDNISLEVMPPFNVNGLSSVQLNFCGLTQSAGTGQFILQTSSGTVGAAILWDKGTLANAPDGVLIVVFDVNFMMTEEMFIYDVMSDFENNLQFLKNIFAAMEGTLDPPPPPAPIETHTVTFATAPGISLSVGNREEVQSGNTIIVYITIDPEGLRADVPTPIVKVDGQQVTVHESRTAADFYFRTPSITKDTRVEISFDGSPLSNNAPDANLTIYSDNGQLTVEASEPVQLTIVSLSGKIITNQRVTGGAHTFSLPAGVYVVNGKKIIAP